MPLGAPRKGYGHAGTGGRGYIGNGIISTVREESAAIMDLLAGRYFLRSGRYPGSYRIGLPMGRGAIPVQQPGNIVPAVVVGTVGTEKTSVPPPLDRRDVAQNSEVLRMIDIQVINTTTASDYWAKKLAFPKADVRFVHPGNSAVILEPPPKPPGIIAPPTTTTGGSMDLGSIITDLGKAYITTKYAPSTSQPLPTVQPAYSLPEVGGDIIDFFTGADGTIVPVKAKKKCRRRRRRLATKSDLGDLAALKAILGNGEAFKAWIATHSR